MKNVHNIFMGKPEGKRALGKSRCSLENIVGLDALVVIVLATGAKVRGFKPGRGLWTFEGDKYP
jgi:hypothetical protein